MIAARPSTSSPLLGLLLFVGCGSTSSVPDAAATDAAAIDANPADASAIDASPTDGGAALATLTLTFDGDATVYEITDLARIRCPTPDQQGYSLLHFQTAAFKGEGPFLDIDLCHYDGPGSYAHTEGSCGAEARIDVSWHEPAIGLHIGGAESDPCVLDLTENGAEISGELTCAPLLDITRDPPIYQGELRASFRCAWD